MQIRRAFGPGHDRGFLFFVLVCLPPFIPPGTFGLRFRPARAPFVVSRGSFFVLGPPSGPQSEFDPPPSAPFEIPVALPHAPGTPSGPSKNRSKRKTKILKSAKCFLQKSSPGELLPIQDPPKRAPLDLIHFPQSLLGNF